MRSTDWLPVQGMSDIAAPEVFLWQELESRARRIFRLYEIEEIRTPLIERRDLFDRALGESADVVRKEMYAFADRGGRQLALRPEGTAGVMRHVAGRAGRGAGHRLFYLGPMFRAERPQAGRRRQFHQAGVEFLGPPDPVADAECIALQVHLLREWGLEGFTVRVNTRGAREDHAAVSDGIRAALGPRLDDLCPDCRVRAGSNPLRVLDCKQPRCGDLVETLPPVTAWMKPGAAEYLEDVLALLDRLGVSATRAPRLVRGLDYYRQTIWEIAHDALGAQDALSGGGRYEIDAAGQTIGGVGFAIGLERVLLALGAAGVRPERFRRPPDAWIVCAGEGLAPQALPVLQDLRAKGVACGADWTGRSLKAQMRAAGRSGAAYAVVLGEEEFRRGAARLKRLSDGAQADVPLAELHQAVMNECNAFRGHPG